MPAESPMPPLSLLPSRSIRQNLGWCAIALLLLGCTNSNASADPASPPDPSTSNVSQVSAFASPQVLPVTATVNLGGETINLEVTRTPQEQATGLMFREKLPDDRGMLFTFNPPRSARFWMKNVVIDLDMVFVHEGKIVEIAADVPPCVKEPCDTYGPPITQLVEHVIELRGGRAAELGLKPGDPVKIVEIEG